MEPLPSAESATLLSQQLLYPALGALSSLLTACEPDVDRVTKEVDRSAMNAILKPLKFGEMFEQGLASSVISRWAQSAAELDDPVSVSSLRAPSKPAVPAKGKTLHQPLRHASQPRRSITPHVQIFRPPSDDNCVSPLKSTVEAGPSRAMERNPDDTEDEEEELGAPSSTQHDAAAPASQPPSARPPSPTPRPRTSLHAHEPSGRPSPAPTPAQPPSQPSAPVDGKAEPSRQALQSKAKKAVDAGSKVSKVDGAEGERQRREEALRIFNEAAPAAKPKRRRF